MVKKVQVTQRAVIQRINRKLSPENRKLKAARSEQSRQNLGDFYVLDVYRNTVDDTHVDIDGMARGLSCLQEWEQLSEGE